MNSYVQLKHVILMTMLRYHCLSSKMDKTFLPEKRKTDRSEFITYLYGKQKNTCLLATQQNQISRLC